VATRFQYEKVFDELRAAFPVLRPAAHSAARGHSGHVSFVRSGEAQIDSYHQGEVVPSVCADGGQQ
jgi:hypothetical protein